IERQRIEDRLRRKQSRMQQYLDLAGVLFVGLDPDGRVTLVNPKTCRTLGVAEADLLGAPWVDRFVPEGHRADVRSVFERLLTGALEPNRVAEGLVITRDGEERTILWSNAVLQSEDGHPIGTLSSGVDVTQRRAAEAALRASEERLNFALESGQMGTWEVNYEDGGGVIWSAQTERLFGIEPGTFGGTLEDVRALIHPEDRAAVKQELQQAVATDKAYEQEYRAVWPDGTIRWMIGRGRAERDETGKVLRVGGTVVDITGRKRAEQRVRESEQRWRTLVENNPTPIVINADDHVLYVNPAGAELLGVEDARDLIGQSVSSFIAPEDRPLYFERLAQPLTEDGTTPQTFRLRTKTGEERLVEAFTVPVVYRGQAAGQTVVRDITAQRQYEARLVEAKERAEEMSRLKSAFLANMSHEIRTPLTAVIGFAELLCEQVDGPAIELAEMVHSGGERLLKTLNSVLDLAQLESKSVTLHWERCDVRTMVQDAAATFCGRAQQRGVQLHAATPAQPVWATLDAGAFTRILDNLVSNAVKFTPDGHITVGAMLDGGDLVVWVSDTGIGIHDSFRQHLFEAFSQESTGTARDYEGTGIGMTITRQLVELMGGTIAVNSVKGGGSTFTIRLPPRSADEARTDPASGRPLE
ncbi:MAG: PAS domain S-box protein, partial [Bacteroidetes bacterium]|nr:PAS domain S-box protein [Bacteroidota bacterium]